MYIIHRKTAQCETIRLQLTGFPLKTSMQPLHRIDRIGQPFIKRLGFETQLTSRSWIIGSSLPFVFLSIRAVRTDAFFVEHKPVTLTLSVPVVARLNL